MGESKVFRCVLLPSWRASFCTLLGCLLSVSSSGIRLRFAQPAALMDDGSGGKIEVCSATTHGSHCACCVSGLGATRNNIAQLRMLQLSNS